MAMTDNQWVALNLPRNSVFSKNGVTITVADTITLALSETQVDGANVKEKALAMLLRMLASNYPFDSGTFGDFQYSKQQLTSLADYWDAIGNGGADPGGLTSVPAVFDSLVTDED